MVCLVGFSATHFTLTRTREACRAGRVSSGVRAGGPGWTSRVRGASRASGTYGNNRQGHTYALASIVWLFHALVLAIVSPTAQTYSCAAQRSIRQHHVWRRSARSITQYEELLVKCLEMYPFAPSTEEDRQSRPRRCQCPQGAPCGWR